VSTHLPFVAAQFCSSVFDHLQPVWPDMSDTMLAAASAAAQTQDLKGFLDPNDTVAVSFWIVSMAMVASTVFFLMESTAMSIHWKTSMNVGALVTLVAAVHYFYMREFWVQIHSSPTVYRYIDWSITVPLQMIEFYLILSAIPGNKVGVAVFWKLLVGTVVMLAFGYAGEAGLMNAWVGFIIGMAGWGFILFEISAGDNVMENLKSASEAVQSSFNTMRFIVTVGWSIYPLGYFFGFLCGSVDDSTLNLVYNLADFINKIAFCLAIWVAAKKESLSSKKTALAAADGLSK
jgi:bacteriorhodopsin